MNDDSHIYDVVIIGGGASGTALLYTLATYTDIKSVLLLEKYDRPGQVNSRASNNSQTLHVGDIETNYSLEKVRQVKPASLMVAHYADTLPSAKKDAIIFTMSKMVLGVGAPECATLEKRFEHISTLFPDLQRLEKNEIARVEPLVVEGRDPKTPLLALYTEKGYAVDFEALSQSFVDQALGSASRVSARFGSSVTSIVKGADGIYTLAVHGKSAVRAKIVVVDADSYSLFFAKQLGYGKNYSLIPIAGSFYFSKKMLNGKVYTIQEPLLPFAAVHGDPDVCVGDVTRWGPTARFKPVLESRKGKTAVHFLRSSGLGKVRTWKSFMKILLEPVRFKYLVKNMFYELPWMGKRLFVCNVQKIVPSLRARDLRIATNYGGMRLQRVNTDTHELELGEGKIVGDNIIFNMTPSPGASVCLFNALRDAEQIVSFGKGEYVFDDARMKKDLLDPS